jgi:hypothetical protein
LYLLIFLAHPNCSLIESLGSTRRIQAGPAEGWFAVVLIW